MHQNRISKSSNMLHYSNASSRDQSRRYLVIKGGACLVALASRRGRQLRSRTGQQQCRSRSLLERRGGRNSKYNANISMTMRDMTMNGTRCVLTRQQVVPAKGGTFGRYSRCFAFSDRRTGGESCQFDRLGRCGGRTDCVSGFVSSF